MSDHDASAIGDGSAPEVISKQRAMIDTPIECNSIENLQNQLRRVLEPTSFALVPPLVTTNLYLNSTATFKVSSTLKNPESNKHQGPKVEEAQAASLNDGAVLDSQTNNANEISMTEVLKATDDPKVRIKMQAVVARQIVRAIRDVDGFGYGLQSAFDSKKNGHRLTFGCHDSNWNRERKRRAKSLEKSQEGPGSRLFMRPTFNCGGEIIVRFQRTLFRIDVIYAHMAIHRSIASRRSQPTHRRPPRFLNTFQSQLLPDRGARGAANDPGADAQLCADPQPDGPLRHLNGAGSPVTAESQGVGENGGEDAGTREDDSVSRNPSSPLGDADRPDETLHNKIPATRNRQQIPGLGVLIPWDQQKRFKDVQQ